MELKDYYRILKLRWKSALVGFLVLFLGSQLYFTATRKPVYSSTGEMLIKWWMGSASPVPVLATPPEVRINQMKRREVLEKLSQKLEDENDISLDVRTITENLSVQKQKDRVYKVSYQSTNKKIPQDLLTKLGDLFFEYDRNNSLDFLFQKKKNLQEELEEHRNRIQDLEESLEETEINSRTEISEYKRQLTQDFSPVAAQSPEITLNRLSERLKDLDQKQASLKEDRRTILRNIDLIQKFQEKKNQSGSAAGEMTERLINKLNLDENSKLKPLVDKREELKTRRIELLTRYRPIHPEVQRVSNLITRLDKQIAQQYLEEVLNNKLQGYQHRLTEIKAELDSNRDRQAQISSRIQQLNDYLNPINKLENKLALEKKSTNKKLSTLRNEIDNKSDALAEVTDHIQAQEKWVSWHNKPEEPMLISQQGFLNNLPFSLLLGLIGLVSLPVVREYFSKLIRKPADVRAYLGLNPIASVPMLQDSPVIDWERERDYPIRELFNKLAVFFDSLTYEMDRSTFMISSSHSGEGKTFICTNLSIALARSGSKVLLVDTDFRVSNIHSLFNVPEGPGVSDVLRNLKNNPEMSSSQIREQINQHSHTTSINGLEVLTSGSPIDNPLPLIKSAGCKKFFDTLEEMDYTVICDSSPLAPLVDAALLASYAAGIVLVIAEGEVRRTEAAHVKHTLNQVGVNSIGAILNKIQFEDESEYYYYSYLKDKYY